MIFLNGMVQGDLIERDPKSPREVTCITLWLPWAMWVAWGWKTIETRTHNRFQSLVGKLIGIHAALKWDQRAIEIARPYLTTDQVRQTIELFKSPPAGCIVAVAQPQAHRLLTPEDAPAALIECNTRRFGLDFGKRTQAVEKPCPVKGARGIWKTTLRFQ
jgi:hypothetical protein